MSLVDKSGEAFFASLLERIHALENQVKYLKRIEVPKKSEISGIGAMTFTGLGDTPGNYTGDGGKAVAVTTLENGVEFVAFPTGLSSFTELADSPASYAGHATKAVTVNALETGLSFTDHPDWKLDQSPSSIHINNIPDLSGTYALDGDVVHVTGAESVGGVKTFTSFSVTPSSAPYTDYQVANKKYVDDNSGGGGDAADITYTPLVLTDWDSDLDPGNTDDALDQLAERVDDLEAGGGGGATTFVGLTDTPSVYTGQALKVVSVNAGETALEFTTPSGGGGSTDILMVQVFT